MYNETNTQQALRVACEIIAHFEGFRSTVYADVGGVPTIGYGDTLLPKQGVRSITEEKAREVLRKRVEMLFIKHVVTLKITPLEAASLLDLLYNVGASVKEKTLWSTVVNGKPEWWRLLAYIHAAGKPLLGLCRRRIAAFLCANSCNWRLYTSFDDTARKLCAVSITPREAAREIIEQAKQRNYYEAV